MSVDVGYVQPPDDGRSFETGRVGLGEVQIALVRMESTIAGLRQEISFMREAQMTRSTEAQRQLTDHEIRLRTVEAKRYVETRSFSALFAILLPALAIVVSIIAIIVKR